MSLPVALGLYTVRDLYAQDLNACLEKAAEIGYAGVECFGTPTLPAEDVAAMLKKHGLTLVGWHLPIETLEGDALDRTAAYLKAVGASRAVVPYMDPAVFTDREAILAFAARLNAIAKALAPHGIALGYHNHDAEFIPLADGTLPWAVLMDAAEIFGQLDNGNALHSGTPGLDGAALISRWPGRATTIHCKPHAQAKGFKTMIGEDGIDWKAHLEAAEKVGGTQWLIVEYEEDDLYGQIESAAMCLRALEGYL